MEDRSFRFTKKRNDTYIGFSIISKEIIDRKKAKKLIIGMRLIEKFLI
ncbi:MAG: hypothetical protein H8E13_03525 [Actinobacteria bacterium]|nr:hypothetical protein [Actinomycetota bacterium]